MARTLLLLRHAKSSWDDPALDDFDRPLAKRGREAAPRMGRAMARRGWLPDLALVSSSLRTRQTWALVAPELPRDIPASFDDTIYEAPAGRILDAIRAVPDDVATLLVVGHNPGFETLTAMLAGKGGDADALERMGEKFPTAALARLSFEESWADLGPGPAFSEGKAALTHFLTPRTLTPHDGDGR